MLQVRTKQKNKNVLKMGFGDMTSGHSSYVTSGFWERGLRPGLKPTSPRLVGHISLQHHKNCLASLLVQGHPVERKKFYISAGSGCRLANKVVSVARQRTSMTCFKDFQNDRTKGSTHTHTHTHTQQNGLQFNPLFYSLYPIYFTLCRKELYRTATQLKHEQKSKCSANTEYSGDKSAYEIYTAHEDF